MSEKLKQAFAEELFNDPEYSKVYNERICTMNRLKQSILEAGISIEAVNEFEKAAEEYHQCLIERYSRAIRDILKIG